MPRKIAVAVIGSGFMGRAHARAYKTVSSYYSLPFQPTLKLAVSRNIGNAKRIAAEFDFECWSDRWLDAIEDPDIGIIAIATPVSQHAEIAIAAAKAGKHVHCEKPMAVNADEALKMSIACTEAGVRTQLGFNYIKNPMIKLAKEIIDTGELGNLVGFRGVHAEDYMADPAIAHDWRTDELANGGALAELGSHILMMATYLVGNVFAVNATLDTIVAERPLNAGASLRSPVKVDDVARMNLRFANGVGGLVEANWLAAGRKMNLGWEINGTAGSLVFSQERMSEILLFKHSIHQSTNGFVRIEAGPQHEPYDKFCPAPGHQMGFNDLKIVEVADFLLSISEGLDRGPTFQDGLHLQCVLDAARASAKNGDWQKVLDSRVLAPFGLN